MNKKEVPVVVVFMFLVVLCFAVPFILVDKGRVTGNVVSGVKKTTYVLTEKDFKEGIEKRMVIGSKFKIEISKNYYFVELSNLSDDIGYFSYNNFSFNISRGEKKKLDLNNNSVYDTSIELKDIINSTALVIVNKSSGVVVIEVPEKINETVNETTPQIEEEVKKEDISFSIIILVVGFGFICFLVLLFFLKALFSTKKQKIARKSFYSVELLIKKAERLLEKKKERQARAVYNKAIETYNSLGEVDNVLFERLVNIRSKINLKDKKDL